MFRFKFENQRFSSNIQKFIDYLDDFQKEENKKPINEREILPPSTDPQLVVNCLQDLFLGENWYVAVPISTKQINTVILHDILYKYCKAYRKYLKKKRFSDVC